MIHICNWLLTRRCNLNCSYCGIVKYNTVRKKDEMTTDYIKSTLSQIKNHNPECFHILYGGEPLLRNDLPEIVEFCNQNNIYYTIISNNTVELQDRINNLIKNTSRIDGFTGSIDPVIFDDEATNDIKRKSLDSLNQMLRMKEHCNDLVAETTITQESKNRSYELVRALHGYGVTTDITFVDVAKNEHYDFSNVTDPSILVHKDQELECIFNRIKNEKLNVHFVEMLDDILNILPSNLDCKIEEELHNISIDADGTLRLCLRIGGDRSINVDKIFDDNYEVRKEVQDEISRMKQSYCQGCNWTCMIMSNLLRKNPNNVNELVHLDRR